MLDLLDVAIGLIFVFTVLSLIASAVTEAIAAFFSLRGAMLWEALGRLVGEKLRGTLYASPLIRGLARKKRKPSYLEAELFTVALIEQVLSHREASGQREASGDLDGLREALRACVDKATPSTSSTDETNANDSQTQATNAIAKLAPALLALIHGTTTLKEAKLAISAWYDGAMERLSGLYKRRIHAILFAVGLALAVVLGVDARAIAKALWENPSLRNSSIEMAQALAEDPKIQARIAELESKSKPGVDGSESTNGEESESADDDDPCRSPETATELRVCEARAYTAKLQGARLPLDPYEWGEKGWLKEHWLGALLAALATSMGAPFWFDLLGGFINLRSSIKPQQKQPPNTNS